MARGRAFTSPHSSPYARLTANVSEEGDCWCGTERSHARRGGYGQVTFWVPGLGKSHKMSAHLLTWIASQIGVDATIDDLYLAYVEFRCSGLELDHVCENPYCRRPDHLDPVTHSENCLRKYRGRDATPAPVFDDAPLPF